jgi:transposase
VRLAGQLQRRRLRLGRQLPPVQLGRPPAVTAAYAATARSLIMVITTLNEQVKALQGQVEENFGQHPDAEIYRSQPGMGAILGARVLGEFGDDPHRYADGKASSASCTDA